MARGEGRTKAQMTEAARGAIYIWCNGVLSYPKALAQYLGRQDLHIYSPSALDDHRLYAGRRLSGIVLDHATDLNARQWEHYQGALARVTETLK